MVAGMTGSGKILWMQSLLQQVQTDRSATRDNNLLLATVATCLHPIIDDDTDHRICQGDPGISAK